MGQPQVQDFAINEARKEIRYSPVGDKNNIHVIGSGFDSTTSFALFAHGLEFDEYTVVKRISQYEFKGTFLAAGNLYGIAVSLVLDVTNTPTAGPALTTTFVGRPVKVEPPKFVG